MADLSSWEEDMKKWLVFYMPQFVIVIYTVVMGCTFCYRKKSEITRKSTLERSKSNSSLKEDQKPKGDSPKGEGVERPDNGDTLGKDNADIQVILSEPPGNTLSDGYIDKLETILETAGNYLWGMKKHMAADEAAWKELAKRITLLHAEGYDVRAGTKEAKIRRMTSKDVPDLVGKVTRKRKRRSHGVAADD
ncbi:unnamed protein product [Cylicocyclus nassatus]|uniref:Uncharacterized protein n=1 Tax=Cylicocyclus nassatus TaxID=53992 RepID=A0AA36M9D6_CYLNA|nr:unnamed protein product [Cylicocyclus nassatus]